MGQRLNLEIHRHGELLANAYYHWSGFTTSAANLVQQIIDKFDDKKHKDILSAVLLLEETGARVIEDELPFVKRLDLKRDFRPARSRNSGLISISEKGMNETRFWEEARAEVDIGTQTVNFSVYYRYPRDDYEEHFEDVFDNLPVNSFNYPFDAIPFDQFQSFYSFVNELVNNKKYQIRDNNRPDSDVISFIV